MMKNSKNKLLMIVVLVVLSAVSYITYNNQNDVNVRVIAGSHDDFMEVRHAKIKGTNFEIGQEIAKIAYGDGIRMAVSGDAYKNKNQLEYLKETFPAYYERMTGSADVFGIEMEDYRYALSYIPQSRGAYGCSASFYPPEYMKNHEGTLSRNFEYTLGDYNFDLDKPPVTTKPIIFELYPEEGYSTLAIVAFDLLGAVIDGVNSEGLTVAILADGTGFGGLTTDSYNNKDVGFHELASMRYILETCKDVEEAKVALDDIKHFVNYASCHYIIADRSGESFIFELTNNGSESHIVVGDGVQVITNHLIYEGAQETTNFISNDVYAKLESFGINNKDLTSEEIQTMFNDLSINNKSDNTKTLWYAEYGVINSSLRVKFYLGGDETKEAIYSEMLYFELEN